MIRLLISFVLACILGSTHVLAWADVATRECPVGQPGPGYCTCFWATDDHGRIPGSDWCDEDKNVGGGCITNGDCNNTVSGLGLFPLFFPPFNVSMFLVPARFW